MKVKGRQIGKRKEFGENKKGRRGGNGHEYDRSHQGHCLEALVSNDLLASPEKQFSVFLYLQKPLMS